MQASLSCLRAKSRPRLEYVYNEYLYNIVDFRKALGHASYHRGSGAQRLMDVDEIVIHHVRCDRVRMVLDFLPIRNPLPLPVNGIPFVEIQASRAPFLFAMPKVDKTKAGTRNLDKEIGQWECLEYGKVASVFINKAEETV